MSVCVVVVLDRPTADAVRTLWSEFQSRWGVELSHPPCVPHLTLVTVKGRAEPHLLRPGLAGAAATFSPFPVSSAGYGIFIARGPESSVIHVALTRTPKLSALQDQVIRVVNDCGGKVDGLSQPQFWRPHITLADAGLTPVVVGEAFAYLTAHAPRHWTFEIDNVAIVMPDGSIPCQFGLEGDPLRGTS
jgi:2'-5' RNA ligase